MIGVCCSMHSRLNLFLLCYLCVCLHSGRWCLLPGFASISSDLNDLGISFDMCRWNLQSSCDPWHWSFCSTCAAHLGSSPGLCSWCWDVLRTSCKLKLSNTVSDIKVGILQIYCKWYYANLQDEKNAQLEPLMSATQCLHCLVVVVVVFLVCHLQLHFFGWFGESRNFSDRTVFDLDFIMMVYWISNFGQPHVSVVKVISVLAPPSLLKSSAINFDGFSYWGCGEKEALQQSDRGIFAFLQFSLSVHVKWTSIRLESWHCPKAFCILQSNICYFFAGWWPTTWSTAAAAQGIFVFFLVVFKH